MKKMEILSQRPEMLADIGRRRSRGVWIGGVGNVREWAEQWDKSTSARQRWRVSLIVKNMRSPPLSLHYTKRRPYHSYFMAEKSYQQTCSKADIHACCCWEVIQANRQQSWHTCLLLLRSHTSKPAVKLTYMLAVAEKSYKQTCWEADVCCSEEI